MTKTKNGSATKARSDTSAKPSRMTHHKDAKVLKVLAKNFDSDADLARELGIKPQALNNWKRRGIAPAMRGDVYKLAVKHRCEPPLEWLTG
jgi:hypothetical protein